MSHSLISGPWLRRIIIWAVMILIVLILYRTGAAIVHNHRLQSQFTPVTPPTPYQLGIPMDEMDLTVYSFYWPTAVALPYYDWARRVETPVTIRYYSEIPDRGSVPALEIKKGTKIFALPEKGAAFKVGYGYTSYPTYEKGWRYVRPFQPADGERLPSSERYYYVRIEDLKAVIGEVIEANQPLRVKARQMRWRFQSPEHEIAVSLDQLLYWNGAYLSPDLLHPVFDRWNTSMTAAAGVLLLLMRLRRDPRSFFRPKSEPDMPHRR